MDHRTSGRCRRRSGVVRAARAGSALVLGALLVAACGTRPGSLPAPPALERPAPPGAETDVSVRVDPARELVVMEAGPFRIPPAGADDAGHHGTGHHGAATPLMLFDWPVDGWYRGFRVRLVDASGDSLPQETMHHLIGVNFDRRQVVYPVPERFMGVGTETPDIVLPRQIGVPMQRGTRLGIYASWHNETGRTIEDAYLRVTLAYTPGDAGSVPEQVVPIYIDTNNRIGDTNAFDLPPGRTVRTYEFTVPVDGALLGLSGHLHDHGRQLRLEDVETGKVLVELDGIVGPDGRLRAVEQKIFRKLFGLLDDRVPLEAGRRYRIVGEYHNPTGRTIEQGAMAHMSGVFAPSTMEGWAELDTTSEAYLRDVGALPRPLRPERAPPGVGDGAPTGRRGAGADGGG